LISYGTVEMVGSFNPDTGRGVAGGGGGAGQWMGRDLAGAPAATF